MKILRSKTLSILLIVASGIGSVASFVLTYDTFQVLKNPSYVPACNINPILSCGSIMQTTQANLLGVPNSIFGLVAFSALLVFGVLLLSGARFARWVWLAAQAAATIGAIFMQYLFFQAVYVLGTICPWCFVVWMITIPTFWYITIYNLQQTHIQLPGRFSTLQRFIQKHHGDILALWYVGIFAILLIRFWDFWVTLL